MKEKIQTLSSKAITLTRQYFEAPLCPPDNNLIEFWQNTLQPLNEIILKYMVVPATSVPSERLFSISGQLIRPARSNLKPKNINMALFLNYNSKLFNFDLLNIYHVN